MRYAYFSTDLLKPQLQEEQVCSTNPNYFPQASQNLSVPRRRSRRLSNHHTKVVLSLSRRIGQHKNELSRLTRQIDEVTESPLMMDGGRRVTELYRQRWRLQESLSNLEDRLGKVFGREVTDVV